MPISVNTAIAQKTQKDLENRQRQQAQEAARAIERQKRIEYWCEHFDREIALKLDISQLKAVITCGMKRYDFSLLPDILSLYDEWDTEVSERFDESDLDYPHYVVNITFSPKR